MDQDLSKHHETKIKEGSLKIITHKKVTNPHFKELTSSMLSSKNSRAYFKKMCVCFNEII